MRGGAFKDSFKVAEVLYVGPLREGGPSLLDVREGDKRMGENARKHSMVLSLFSVHTIALSCSPSLSLFLGKLGR